MRKYFTATGQKKSKVRAFKLHFSNPTIAWFTDNQNVVSIVSNGSGNSELHTMALHLVEVCLASHINLDVKKWVPRDFNTQADSISHILDYDDYTINDFAFTEFDKLWGPYTGCPKKNENY
jgi:ABC-type antimicrobial peptide transport system ATPase subunit